MGDPNLLALVRMVRAGYPAQMTDVQVGEAIYEIARMAGSEWGLLLKPHGHGVPTPIGQVSSDILVHIPERQEYDIFRDAGGETEPVWQKLPFKVGQGQSGASMDRVRVVSGLPPGDEEADVNDTPPAPKPKPRPRPKPEPAPVCRCQCAEVVELLTAMRLENAERHDTIRSQMHRLEVATARARTFTGRARIIGRIDGEVSGVPV